LKKKLYLGGSFFIIVVIAMLSFLYLKKYSTPVKSYQPFLSTISNSDSIAIYFDRELINNLKNQQHFLSDSITNKNINYISKNIIIPKNTTFPSILINIEKIIKGSKYSIINTQVSKYENKIDISIGYEGVISNKLHITKNNKLTDNIKIAIVVTNFGQYDISDEIAILRLPYKFTLAITPFFKRNDLILSETDINRHEIILNMPMEPKVLSKSPKDIISTYIFKHGILARYTSQQIKNKLIDAYNFFDDKKMQPVGMTHMRGFKILRDLTMSKQVLNYCSYKKNYFLYTGNKNFHTIDNIAYESGTKFYRYDDIIDKYGDKKTTTNLLYKYVKKSTKKGSAILLVSPKKSTVEVLKKELGKLEKNGVDFIFVSDIKN